MVIKLAIAEPQKKFFYYWMALKVAEQSKGVLSEAKISVSIAAKKEHVPPIYYDKKPLLNVVCRLIENYKKMLLNVIT